MIEKNKTIQYNTIQYNTIRYDTIRYDTIQYNTIQYNTKNPAVTLTIEILLVWLFNLIGEWWLALPFFHFSIVTLKHSFEIIQVESLKAR